MKLTIRDKFLLYTELAKLVKAGFGIDRSAELLKESFGGPAQFQFAESLASGLNAGRTIAESIGGCGLGISALERSILEATERGGVIEEGLGYLRDYFGTVQRTRRSIRSRLIYPIILLHMGAFMAVLPPLLSGGPWQEALRTAFLTLGIVYLGGAGLWIAGRTLNEAATRQLAADRFLRRLPLLGGARRLIALERFSQIFRIFLLCGQRVSDGLAAAGEATRSAVLHGAARELSRRAEAGDAIGPAMVRSGAFPADFARSVANAETVGGMEEDLERWTRFFAEGVETRMEQIGVWMPKLVYLLVVVYVAWQIVTMYAGIYAPIFELMEENF